MQLFRRWSTLSSDPEFPYRVGRLIGAAEMAGHMLNQSSDPEQSRYGALILDRVEWFLGEGTSKNRAPEMTPDSEKSTRAISPAPK